MAFFPASRFLRNPLVGASWADRRSIFGRAACSALLLGIAAPLTSSTLATDLVALDGRRFSDCQVLKVDDLGVYVRHRTGIARVLFEDFSEELLAALGPLPENEPGLETVPPGKSAGLGAGDRQADAESESEAEAGSVSGFQLVFWQRVTYGVPTSALATGYRWQPGYTALPPYYRFPCRQAVEADFLITSGILPHPAGVVTRGLPLGGGGRRWLAF